MLDYLIYERGREIDGSAAASLMTALQSLDSWVGRFALIWSTRVSIRGGLDIFWHQIKLAACHCHLVHLSSRSIYCDVSVRVCICTLHMQIDSKIMARTYYIRACSRRGVNVRLCAIGLVRKLDPLPDKSKGIGFKHYAYIIKPQGFVWIGHISWEVLWILFHLII